VFEWYAMQNWERMCLRDMVGSDLSLSPGRRVSCHE